MFISGGKVGGSGSQQSSLVGFATVGGGQVGWIRIKGFKFKTFNLQTNSLFSDSVAHKVLLIHFK